MAEVEFIYTNIHFIIATTVTKMIFNGKTCNKNIFVK